MLQFRMPPQCSFQGKWHVQLNEGRESDLPHKLEPVGYVKGVSTDKDSNGTVTKTATNTIELKKKRAMEIGMAPFKSLLQTGFMMWMSGNSINIFSIMITGMIVMNTAKSLFNMNNAFASVNDGVISLTQPKAIYMAGSLIGAAMGVYKCSNMGLLPTTSADWTWLLPIKHAVETSSFAYSL
ncbi:Predicted membrane protein [Plasmopara halstedii]|uniref:ER membrane protein complex subunit 4 n=1 Tax=Plasmopara halstedii TaxID=4781 RepID=A0A0P1AB59_PLAHL|nr:Predicted membrane protein [Plasmopara halstedii]CEG38118.1 Predicted membrane protein [Plasmopara halstedii]|eukprot:XP_024574487.1 Predicted membrane protein [Plasmopara halstedii]